MTPSAPPNLSGNQTTWAGIIQLIFAGLGVFTQVWGTIHGHPVDPTTLALSGGLAAGGATGLMAADRKQTK